MLKTQKTQKIQKHSKNVKEIEFGLCYSTCLEILFNVKEGGKIKSGSGI